MLRLNLRSTAFHEAGHAVVALLKNIPFSKVWILRREDTDPVPQNIPLGQLTRAVPLNKPDFAGKLEEAKVEATQAFAGPIAECLAYPEMKPDWELNDGDVKVARSVLRFATLPFTINNGMADFDPVAGAMAESEMQWMLNECCQAAAVLVNENRERIEKVAMELLVRWELTEVEVRNFCK